MLVTLDQNGNLNVNLGTPDSYGVVQVIDFNPVLDLDANGVSTFIIQDPVTSDFTLSISNGLNNQPIFIEFTVDAVGNWDMTTTESIKIPDDSAGSLLALEANKTYLVGLKRFNENWRMVSFSNPYSS